MRKFLINLFINYFINMAQQSTPIENIRDRDSNNGPAINETNLSTAQQILQKYNEMDTGDADTQRQQVNGNMQERQLDPNMNKQQRLQELEDNQRIQQQNMNNNKNKQVQQNTNTNNILNKLNDVIINSQDKLKDVVIVIFLFIGLNLDFFNNLIMHYVPFLFNENSLNMNGIIAKGLVGGLIFYIISTLLVVL